MDRKESYWHTSAAHYVVLPNLAWYSGPGPWALVVFTHAGERILSQGTYGECCRALAALRSTEEGSKAS